MNYGLCHGNQSKSTHGPHGYQTWPDLNSKQKKHFFVDTIENLDTQKTFVEKFTKSS